MEVSLTLILVIGTAVFSMMAFSNGTLMEKYKLSPYAVVQHKQWYRILTHGFLHVDTIHLAVNMWVLYMFGSQIELCLTELFFYADAFPDGEFKGKTYGYVMYGLLYVGGLTAATIPSLLKHENNAYYSAVGASGAVSGVVFAYILMFPMQPLSLLFIPFDMPAILFGGLYLASEIYLDKSGKRTGIAHDAHWSGAIFGLIFIAVIEPSLLKTFIAKLGVF